MVATIFWYLFFLAKKCIFIANHCDFYESRDIDLFSSIAFVDKVQMCFHFCSFDHSIKFDLWNPIIRKSKATKITLCCLTAFCFINTQEEVRTHRRLLTHKIGISVLYFVMSLSSSIIEWNLFPYFVFVLYLIKLISFHLTLGSDRLRAQL